MFPVIWSHGKMSLMKKYFLGYKKLLVVWSDEKSYFSLKYAQISKRFVIDEGE